MAQRQNRQANHPQHGAQDVELAMAAADTFDGFIAELQAMGYMVKYGPRVEQIKYPKPSNENGTV